MSESAPLTPGEIPVSWIHWTHVGQVSVDHNGDLVFPPVRPVPGIYRFTISDGPEPVAEYIGQAAVSLVTRFGLYRSRGKKPSLPLANKTTSRNARHLLDALASGHSVSVALVDDHVTAPDGQMKMIDLADKTLRDGLEKKLIAWLCTTGAEVLNRDFNPGWGGAAEPPRPQNDIEPVPADEMIHREYLPFTPRQLNDHFAPVTAMGDHLAYYRASAKRAADFNAGPLAGTPAEIRQAIKWGRQMEKDERFWVAATLMQGGDGFQPHAAVDRLGGEGVPQPVRVDAGNPGGAADAVHDPSDQVRGPAGRGGRRSDAVAADVVEVSRGPGGEQASATFGVRRHVAVVAELAQRDAQPVPGADQHHRIGVEIGQYAGPHPGPGEQFDHEPVTGVGAGPRGGHQFRGVAVVEELWQRLGFFGDVPCDHWVAGRVPGQSHSMIRSKNGRTVRIRCRCVPRSAKQEAPVRGAGRSSPSWRDRTGLA